MVVPLHPLSLTMIGIRKTVSAGKERENDSTGARYPLITRMWGSLYADPLMIGRMNTPIALWERKSKNRQSAVSLSFSSHTRIPKYVTRSPPDYKLLVRFRLCVVKNPHLQEVPSVLPLYTPFRRVAQRIHKRWHNKQKLCQFNSTALNIGYNDIYLAIRCTRLQLGVRNSQHTHIFSDGVL